MFKNILINTGAQFFGKLVTASVAFLTTILLAHTLGPHYYGQLTAVVAYLGFFYVVSDFGMNQVYLEMHDGFAEKKQALLLGLRLIVATVLCVVSIGGAYLFQTLNHEYGDLIFLSVVVGSVSLFTNSIFLSTAAIFQSRLKYRWVSVAQSTGAIAGLFMVLIFYPAMQSQPHLGPLVGILSVTLGSFVSAGASLYLLFREKALIINFFALKKKDILSLFYRSAPLGMTLLFNVVYFRLDTMILAASRSASEVGEYGLAYKFFEFLLVLPTFVMNSTYPYFLKHKSNPIILRPMMRKSFVILLVVSVVCTAAVWISAPILHFIVSDYRSLSYLLRLLSLGLPLFFLSSPLMWLFVIMKEQKKLLIVYVISMVFNVTCGIIFIPQYGAVAAATITTLTEMIVVGSGFVLLKKYL